MGILNEVVDFKGFKVIYYLVYILLATLWKLDAKPTKANVFNERQKTIIFYAMND